MQSFYYYSQVTSTSLAFPVAQWSEHGLMSRSWVEFPSGTQNFFPHVIIPFIIIFLVSSECIDPTVASAFVTDIMMISTKWGGKSNNYYIKVPEWTSVCLLTQYNTEN